ncbi:MAG: hypothetical protein IKU09_01950 [Firmicutes bacterium]|nr:hypothetical protein [Bacillota bacterium]
MKKMISIVMLLTMVFMSVNVCYAAVETGTASPRYVSVAYYNNTFDIQDSGMACYELTISPNPQILPDKVTATVKIVNADTERSVYTKTQTMSYSSITRKFTAADSKQLTARGEYEMSVTYKCYNGSTLLETITAPLQTAMY